MKKYIILFLLWTIQLSAQAQGTLTLDNVVVEENKEFTLRLRFGSYFSVSFFEFGIKYPVEEFKFLEAQFSVSDKLEVVHNEEEGVISVSFEEIGGVYAILGLQFSFKSLGENFSCSSIEIMEHENGNPISFVTSFREYKGEDLTLNNALIYVKNKVADPIVQKDFSIVEKPGLSNKLLKEVNSSSHPNGIINNDHFIYSDGNRNISIIDRKGTIEDQFSIGPNSSSQSTFGKVLFNYQHSVLIVAEYLNNADAFSLSLVQNNHVERRISVPTPIWISNPSFTLWNDFIMISSRNRITEEYFVQILDVKDLISGTVEPKIRTVHFPIEAEYDANHIMNPVSANGFDFETNANPILLSLRDDDWNKEPQDRIELLEIDLNLESDSIPTIEKTEIPLASFNTYLTRDALISNAPQYYKFTEYESLVFCFSTQIDANGSLRGIRWVELRKEEGTKWYKYQEGTFGLEDFKSRIYPAIAKDNKEQMVLTYLIRDSFGIYNLGITGRDGNDPLGQMSRNESILTNSTELYAGYPDKIDANIISIDPVEEDYFWFTSQNGQGTQIFAIDFETDSIDLSLDAIVELEGVDSIGQGEIVNLKIRNRGLEEEHDFKVEIYLNNKLVNEEWKHLAIPHLESKVISLDSLLHPPVEGFYTVRAELKVEGDEFESNNFAQQSIERLVPVEAQLNLVRSDAFCDLGDPLGMLSFSLLNFGFLEIENARIEVKLNEEVVWNFNEAINLPSKEERIFTIESLEYEEENHIEINLISITADGFAYDLVEKLEVESLRSSEVFKVLDVGIRVDEKPRDITWTIREIETWNLVANGGPYLEPDITYFQRLCLSPYYCYLFEIFDASGDGISVSPSQFAYSLRTDFNSFLLNEPGDFGSHAIHGFCIDGPRCQIKPNIIIEPASDATSEDGSIDIQLLNRIELFRYRVGGFGPFVETSFFDNLKSGYYPIEVFSDNSNCEFIDTVFVPHQGVVSDSEIAPSDGIHIFPNPSNGKIQIHAPHLIEEDSPNKMSVYNLQGKELEITSLSFDRNSMASFDLSHLPKGIYFLK